MDINTPYLLDTLKKSIEINSVIPREEKLAAFFADEIRKLGVEPEWHIVAEGRPNVYALADLGGSDKMVLLTGHLDTVDVAENWETDPFEAVEKDGKLYGLGSYDMKSGLVCALGAFKGLIEDESLCGKLGKVAFAATMDEEGYGLGAKALLETTYAKSDCILLTEPYAGTSDRPLPMGMTGKLLYKITVTGKMAHGFHPERGINAIEDAGKIVAALDQLHLHTHPEYGAGNYSTLKIEGGYKEYAVVVPEKCEIIITRLTVPGETVETALRDMRQLVESLNLASQVAIETPPPFYNPYTIDTQSHFGRSFQQAFSKQFGSPPPFAFLQGIDDSNIYVAEGGIPTIGFGPSGNGAHECNEYVDIHSLKPVTQVLIDCVINFFS